jgi:hypothetical protein
LVVNYVGHGGEVGLAEERVVTVPQVQSWNNINKLNLFVSATCEFTKYDDPARLSAGEYVSLNAVGGAIALMTTSRSVFFGVNTVTGLQFYEHVFTRDSNNEPLAFGEIMRLTKNAVQGKIALDELNEMASGYYTITVRGELGVTSLNWLKK